MTPTAQRVLMALGAVGVAVLVGQSLRGGAAPEGPATTSAPRTPATAGGTAASSPLPVADVRLELLTQPRADAAETDRNPFRFRERPAPPPRPVTPARPVPTAPPPPAVPQGPPPPPAITLRLIGLLNAPTQAGRVAVLSDGRGNVFNGREGDIIEGRYRLLKIGADSAELAYTDGRGRQVIRLAGQ